MERQAGATGHGKSAPSCPVSLLVAFVSVDAAECLQQVLQGLVGVLQHLHRHTHLGAMTRW